MANVIRDFIERLSVKLGVTPEEAARMVDIFTETVRLELLADHEVFVHKLMTIRTVDRAERAGRNPRTGEAITIPARKAIVAEFSPSLKKAINEALAPVPAKKYTLKATPTTVAKKPAPKKK